MKKGKKTEIFFDSKSVFFRWFLSYIIMLIFALIASMAIYFYAFRVIDNQQKMPTKLCSKK